MSAFAEFSTTPDNNTSAFGISIAENCPAANINNFARACVAAGKELNTQVAAISTSTLMPKSGGAFTGQITRSGAGGYLYNAASAQGGGAVYVLPTGTALPTSPQEGTFVFFY